jgi:predicted O-methyltransferase YrrM
MFRRLLKRKAEVGQIRLDHPFGTFLWLAVQDPQVHSVVEIGTWNGMGSTLCIEEGLLASGEQSKQAISLEANSDMYHAACQNLGANTRISLLHGTIVAESDLDREALTDQEAQWILGDVGSLKSAPNVLESLPKEIDLLLLDGGEFSSNAEFGMLRSRLRKWLFLDDTKVRKNSAVREWIHSSPDSRFVPVFESDDRNGWGVYLTQSAGDLSRPR